MWIHMETAYYGGSVRLTMELQGYCSLELSLHCLQYLLQNNNHPVPKIQTGH